MHMTIHYILVVYMLSLALKQWSIEHALCYFKAAQHCTYVSKQSTLAAQYGKACAP
jgi:hypothetical protein